MERIIGQVKDQEELAKQVLSWITCAKRPLTTTELQHALAVEIGESQLDKDNLPEVKDIVSVCAGLVTVDEESGIIRLVHYTTQEYFDRTQGKWFPNVQTNITATCVAYLSFDVFECGICQNDKEFEQRLQIHRLYDYAAHNWGYHAREASTSCQDGVMKFLQKQAQVEASSQALMAVNDWPEHTQYSQQVPKQMTGLHLAAYLGVEIVVRLLLDQGADVEVADSDEETPLHLASSNGQLDMVQLLLDQGANIAAADDAGWTPLHQASRNGHLEVVQLLLDQGANVTAADYDGWTPLHLASENGHLEVVRLLLKQGADIEAADHIDGKTPLHQASHHHLEVVRLLLDQGADVEAVDDVCGWTPLHHPSLNGHLEVVQLLLDYGANVTAAHGWTPLYLASENGHLEVVRLLLKQGADIKAADYDGKTSLHLASENGHLEVVQLLLDQGADT
jgi:ankyrin repeat protein